MAFPYLIAQAAPSTALGTMIVVSGAFLILMLLIKKFAWGAITDILKQREDKIANDLNAAEESRAHAAQMEATRQKELLNAKSEAVQILQQAKEISEQNRQKTLKETTEEVARLRTKTKEDLQQARKETVSGAKEDLSALSLQIAEKILAKELDLDAHHTLIHSYIESLGQKNETQ